jgi:large subunit ribosomal protein L19
MNKLEPFNKIQLKNDVPDIRPGDTVRILQKIKEGSKHKAETFEGLVLARKHGQGISATITVRKVVLGVGVEKIFPLHSPNIEKIEIIKRGKARRAKLYFLKTAKGKGAKLKNENYSQTAALPEDDSAKTEIKKAE